MALLLTDVLQAGLRKIGQLNVFKATGGSTTTIVDTAQIGGGNDDIWKDGAAFIIHDAGNANALPEGQFQRVSAYADATGTITVDTAYTTAVAAGDIFGLISSEYPLQQMIQAVNDGLRSLGDLDLVDTTTLDTATATTEYAAAVAWKRSKPYRIDIQGLTGSPSTDNDWETWHAWEYVPAVAGSTGKIIFSDYQVSGRDIRIWYRGPHPYVGAYSDVIAEVFDPDTVIQAFCVEALQWQNSRVRGADEFMLQRGQEAKQELITRRVEKPRVGVKKKPRLLIVGQNIADEDQFTYPT